VKWAWPRATTAPRLYRLLYRFDDVVLTEGWVSQRETDEARVGRVRAGLPAGGAGTIGLDSPLGPLALKVTLSPGIGLVTASLSGQPLLSSVVLAEGEASGAEWLAQELLASLRRTKPVLQFAPAPERAFERILSTRERPVVGSVHWTIVPADQFARLGALDVDYAAAIAWKTR
jgi:hypothetical protein